MSNTQKTFDILWTTPDVTQVADILHEAQAQDVLDDCILWEPLNKLDSCLKSRNIQDDITDEAAEDYQDLLKLVLKGFSKQDSKNLPCNNEELKEPNFPLHTDNKNYDEQKAEYGAPDSSEVILDAHTRILYK